MFWLIETDKQLDYLRGRAFDKAFIEIIPTSYQEHPCVNDVCAVYIRPLNEQKGFIITISHSEALSISIDKVFAVLNEINKVYVRDKKETLHYFIHKSLYDITLHSPPYIRELPQVYNWFHKQYPEKKDINKIIPLSKHYEYCEGVFNKFKHNIDGEFNTFFNNKASMVFNFLERSGIRIDKTEFEKNFYLPNSDYVYTQYNFKTLTRRPSNKFKGVNYAALSKKDDSRKSFIPRNDFFIELDISAYHPTLLGKLIKYDFGEGDIHEEFSKMYGVDYQKAKELTFKQLYGGVFEEYKELEFFKRVEKYVGELWAEFNEVGYIEVPISKWKIMKDECGEMTPQKLLNYLLQSLETAHHVYTLWDIVKLLRKKNTKIVLYVYDAIILDLDKEEDIIDDIINIYKKYKVKVKLKKGNNYNNLQNLDI